MYNEEQLWQALAAGNSTVTLGAHIQVRGGAAAPGCAQLCSQPAGCRIPAGVDAESPPRLFPLPPLLLQMTPGGRWWQGPPPSIIFAMTMLAQCKGFGTKCIVDLNGAPNPLFIVGTNAQLSGERTCGAAAGRAAACGLGELPSFIVESVAETSLAPRLVQ